jgi:predicted small lipoprotein YifL
MKKLIMSLCLTIIIVSCLSSCGQSGPLYLPDDSESQTASSDQSKRETSSTLH